MTKHTHAAIDAAEDHDFGREVALRLEPVPVEEPAPSFVTRVGRDPSRRLMLAALADAVATFRRTAAMRTPDDARMFAETARWFASQDDDGPFSFVAICRTLGLDAAYLRAGLKSVRARARMARHAAVLH